MGEWVRGWVGGWVGGRQASKKRLLRLVCKKLTSTVTTWTIGTHYSQSHGAVNLLLLCSSPCNPQGGSAVTYDFTMGAGKNLGGAEVGLQADDYTWGVRR